MLLQNIIVILGPPGSGKGTQGKLLSDALHYDYFSMGQFLREYASRGTAMAAKIKQVVDSGRIIPNEWITDIFLEKMNSLPDATGVVIDGFPRDVEQAPILNDFIQKHGIKSLKVIFMQVPEAELVSRILSRNANREDDTPQVLHIRFAEYENKTYPLKEYYENMGVLVAIDGSHTIEEVQQAILNKLGV
jgi:adenylate kinase